MILFFLRRVSKTQNSLQLLLLNRKKCSFYTTCSVVTWSLRVQASRCANYLEICYQKTVCFLLPCQGKTIICNYDQSLSLTAFLLTGSRCKNLETPILHCLWLTDQYHAKALCDLVATWEWFERTCCDGWEETGTVTARGGRFVWCNSWLAASVDGRQQRRKLVRTHFTNFFFLCLLDRASSW